MLLLLAVIFIGMARLILEMALGVPAVDAPPVRENRWQLIGPILLGGMVLMLGLYIPGSLAGRCSHAPPCRSEDQRRERVE